MHRSSRKLTYRGRVVYDRPKHEFTHSDLNRIASHLGKQHPTMGALQAILEGINRTIFIVALDAWGLGALGDFLYRILRWLVEEMVRLLAGNPKRREEILAAAAQSVKKAQEELGYFGI